MATPIHRAGSPATENCEPRMARIPEGWFLMGSEAGQDNERPIHRVWVDAFDVRRLSGNQPRVRSLPLPQPAIANHFTGTTQISISPISRSRRPVGSMRSHSATGSPAKRSGGIVSRRKPSGSAPREAESRASCIPGAMNRRSRCRIIRCAGRMGRKPLGKTRRMHMGSSISARTSTSGARTGIRRITTPLLRTEIPKGPPKANAGHRAADRGGTTRKSRAALRAPAFPRNSNMPTMDFASPATFADGSSQSFLIATKFRVKKSYRIEFQGLRDF